MWNRVFHLDAIGVLMAKTCLIYDPFVRNVNRLALHHADKARAPQLICKYEFFKSKLENLLIDNTYKLQGKIKSAIISVSSVFAMQITKNICMRTDYTY